MGWEGVGCEQRRLERPRAEMPIPAVTVGVGWCRVSLSESKLRQPSGRAGIVARRALIDLLNSVETPVISVVAPAGYGKTTLLAQRAEVWQPRVVWVSADHRDNDPAVLLTYLATAVDRVEPLPPTVVRRLAAPGAVIAAIPVLVTAIAEIGRAHV